MIVLGDRIIQLRKEKNLSQSDFAREIGVSRTIVGNYERNTNMPSIEILLKMANVFNVSIDYIIGEGTISTYDKEVLKRIEDIEKLDEETRKHLYFLVDNVIQNYKTRQAFGK